jgi:hypothetical protein
VSYLRVGRAHAGQGSEHGGHASGAGCQTSHISSRGVGAPSTASHEGPGGTPQNRCIAARSPMVAVLS